MACYNAGKRAVIMNEKGLSGRAIALVLWASEIRRLPWWRWRVGRAEIAEMRRRPSLRKTWSFLRQGGRPPDGRRRGTKRLADLQNVCRALVFSSVLSVRSSLSAALAHRRATRPKAPVSVAFSLWCETAENGIGRA